ncbi:Phosphoglycolate phosphatase [Rhynchospora pubera]|uniref:Phosphoglycolate phosphatase n=1 Tax=Rhynchospora pubera TaxID=906938 RepID=A0AAV8DZS9_9POAL|nr:Phosphoglycolate phosphatase [Rhynchospora pubera]
MDKSDGNGGAKKRVMVTFDIDGTLIVSTGSNSNRLHRQAFAYALKQVFGINDANIDVIPHHGSTDPAILLNTAVYYGISSDLAAEKLPEMKSKMVEYAINNAKHVGEGLEVLPGVDSLLDVLSSNNVPVGLVTGNLEDIAWIKMEGLGLRKHFSVPNFGGFGSDNIDRGELVKIAATRAEKLFPGGFDLRVHVGDTPNDIRAAESGGAIAVGVCTGVFSRAELEMASNGTAIMLLDLTDSKGFMHLLGF